MNVTLVLSGVVSLLGLMFVVLIVLMLLQASRGRPVRSLAVIIVVIGITGVVLGSINAGLVFIQPDERGVVISAAASKGYRDQALQPGLNWIVPFLENVRTYTISRQTYTMSGVTTEGQKVGDDSIVTRTADGQEVRVDASVIYALDPTQIVKVHIEWQDRYNEGLVRPVARGVIRDVISQYRVEEVYSTKRADVSEKITRDLSQKMNDNGLLLIEFVLRDIAFSPAYAESVEKKQIAEQEAQQARFVVEQRKQEAEQARQRAKGEADAAVIRAKGEAEARLVQVDAEARALNLLGQALEGHPELLNYSFVNKIGPGVQTIFLPNNVSYMLPLPTPGATTNPALLPGYFPTPEPTPLPQPTATP